MSPPSTSEHAVFLSYASQDAEAAARICASLRQADIVVWFDQSELVGGDQWDRAIRGQVKTCTLFLPVISASTQERLEGYFRLEWKLAAQRTHTMADAKPFLVPVVIDGTRDFDAHVPDEFRAVQWTRLAGGETSEAFCVRVKKLLVDATTSGNTNAPFQLESQGGSRPAHRTYPLIRQWLTPVIIVAAVITLVALWRTRREAQPPAPSATPALVALPTKPASAAALELAQIKTRLVPDQWQKGDFATVSATLDRLIQVNAEAVDAWALKSIIHSLQTVRQYERGTKPLEVGKSAAERALSIDPASPLAELAYGLHLVAMISRGGDAKAARPYLNRALAVLPQDSLTRFVDLVSYYHGYDFEGAERTATAWLAVEPQALFPPWILASVALVKRQPDKVEQWSEIAMGGKNLTGIRAHVTDFEAEFYLQADLVSARATMERIPAESRSVHRVVFSNWLLAMTEKNYDLALQVLAQLPESFLSDRTYNGPRALLAGLAHQRAGRTNPAATQFREAERLLRENLAADPDNESLHAALAVTFACAGRTADARSELATIEPLLSGRAPSIYRGPIVVLIAQTYRELNEFPALARWLRHLLAEPSDVSFTPASFRMDPRFTGAADAPAVRSLLAEFAHLDSRASIPRAAIPP